MWNKGSKYIEVTGTGYNTVRLVNEAIKEKNNGSYHSVWAVFDKDDFNQFNNAIQITAKNNICVAYSNEAFELWYLLHFNYHDTAILSIRYPSGGFPCRVVCCLCPWQWQPP
ncbi:MAG: RloB domain-containing protein [Nitrospirae bacterium]|nr:RloB domain-containing protein [Nitrospirota bacterium]